MTTKISFWPFLCVLLAAGCLVLWFTRGCGSTPNPVITQNNIVNDTVKKAVERANDAAIVAMGLMADTAQLKADLRKALTTIKKDSVIIHAANSQTTALANEVADAHIALDTLRFIRGCDSLAAATKAYQGTFDMYERDNKNLVNRYNALQANCAASTTALTSEANGYKSAAQTLQKQNSVLAGALTPKNKVFIGIEGFVSGTGGGAGPAIMLQDKRDRLYRIGGGLSTVGSYWFGAGAYIKIQLHR